MSDPRFIQSGFDKTLSHFIEECGEVIGPIGNALAAAGKTQRWGLRSVNPLLPVDQQETNEAWLRRALSALQPELQDLRDVMARLDVELAKATPPLDKGE